MEANFKLRALGSKDVFSMARIIGKIGISNFKKCFDSAEVKQAIASLSEEDKKNDNGLTAVGAMVMLEVADVLISHLPDCEKEIYNFLSDLSGLNVAIIRDMPPADFFEMVVEVIKKPEFGDFLKVASKLFK